MKKEFNINKKVIIDWTLVKDNIYAYSIEIIENDIVKNKIEGISTIDLLEKYNPLEKPLCFLNIKDENNKDKDLYLCYKSIEEAVRTTMFSDLLDDMDNYIILNPYSYLKENNRDIVDLYIVSYCDYSLRNINNIEYPKCIHFDYIEARVDDSEYDLYEFLKILKTRNDIKFTKLPRGEENLIQRIPYYNSTDDKNFFIDFNWSPNKEDYDKVLKFKNENKHLSYYKYIITDIFGIKPLSNSDSSYNEY